MRNILTAIVMGGLYLVGPANLTVTQAGAEQEQPRNAWQTADAYLEAVFAGQIEEAAATAEAGKEPSQPELIKGIDALLVNGATVVSAHANNEHAFAATEEFTDVADREGLLVLTLIKHEDRWLIREIEFVSPDFAKKRLRQFLGKHRDAKPLEAPDAAA